MADLPYLLGLTAVAPHLVEQHNFGQERPFDLIFIFILGLFDLVDSMEQVQSLTEIIFRVLSYVEDEGASRALKEKVAYWTAFLCLR